MRRLPAISTRYLAAALLLLAVSGRAPSAGGDETDLATAIAWQIALDRVGFSGGIIDGRIGPKTVLGTQEFQRAAGLPRTGALDGLTVAALGADARTAAATYTIQAADEREIGPVPKDWTAKSRLSRLAYPSLKELVAEKFHCSAALLERLNGGTDLSRLRAGQALRVPNAAVAAPLGPVRRIDIDLSRKVLRLFAADGRQVGLFHCSIAADRSNLPPRNTAVVGVIHNPTYAFDPRKWPEVRGVRQKLLIPPGPRNPVGLCWIGLGLSGYGIHGTPNPELIGKTGSHGCIRLTNWDAVRLGGLVSAGTTVTFSGR